MVVRETPSLADSVEELLTSEGYRICRVETAHEGVRLLNSRRGRQVSATVVVCNEPVCTGLDTLEASEFKTPLIVLGWRGSPFAGREHPHVVLLRLPISAGHLLENLRTATETAGPTAIPVEAS